MRLFSILTAIIVATALYFLVFERTKLLNFASDEPTVETQPAVVPAEESTGLVTVIAVKSKSQAIDNAVILRGLTEAARQVDVRAETSGLMVIEPLRKGAYVEAGQTLCELDAGARAASLAEANARLVEANINNRAAIKLAKDGFASETRAASAKASLQAAEATVDAAEREIEKLTIKAPFAGLLETDTAELGTLLQPGSLCATIIQLDPIKLVGFAPETEVEKISVGAMAGARLASGRDVTGRVTFLSRSADTQTRTFRVEVQVANSDLAIRDGQTVEIIVASEGTNAHLLPQSALTLNDNGKLGVRLVDDASLAQFVPVNLLRDTVEGVWLSGLPDAANVIVVGQEYVTDGVAVAAKYQEPAQ